MWILVLLPNTIVDPLYISKTTFPVWNLLYLKDDISNTNPHSVSQVLLGEHNYNTASETTSLRMDIAQIKNHGSYNDRTTDYDFSLLKTTSAMDFSAYPNIRPACLPQAGSSETYTNWVATVTGEGERPPILRIFSFNLTISIKMF